VVLQFHCLCSLCLYSCVMPHMVWPTMSPLLNPILVCDQLKQRLNDPLVEEFNALPQNNVMRLVRSMKRCCQTVIAAKGNLKVFRTITFLIVFNGTSKK
uniref:Uncharacterized protein n=1 Tax=Oryzias latipes TaxID=8090 RepID=A0A3P9HVZ2_ORYLA